MYQISLQSSGKSYATGKLHMGIWNEQISLTVSFIDVLMLYFSALIKLKAYRIMGVLSKMEKKYYKALWSSPKLPEWYDPSK